MKLRYVLIRIKKKIALLEKEKKDMQRLKINNPELFNMEQWVEKHCQRFFKLSEIVNEPDLKNTPLLLALKEVLKESYEYIEKYFMLYEKTLKLLNVHYELENELVKSNTLVWFQHGNITGNFMKIISNPESFEMLRMILSENHIKSMKTTFN